MLLDGQQRITSLYGLLRGKPPKFFDGDERAFTGLYFNIKEEVIEFFAPTKMKGDPCWLNVTEVLREGRIRGQDPKRYGVGFWISCQ